MFKKLLILFLVLLATQVSAQELTADTLASAAAPSLLEELLKALLVALVSMLGYIGSVVIPLLNQWLKLAMHFRGSGVVADALTVAFSEMIADVKSAAADGSLSEEDIRWLKARARGIAADKLKGLSGFYKRDLMGWLDEVLEVELGKLLLRIFGSRSSASSTPS